jgi:hypothetical protein
MNNMRIILSALLAVSVAACALPEIYVKGAPEGAVLYVDGLSVGLASQFDGNPKVLIVEEGTHVVELRRGSAVLHTEKVFVSNGESRSLSINAGVTK